MANKKRFRVNPYLAYLLKRMLHYEYVGLLQEPSSRSLAHLIYDRYKAAKFKNTKYSDQPSKRDSFAYSKAERIKNSFLKPKDFFFSKELLNHVVAEIAKAGHFSDWDEFALKHMNDSGYKAAEHRFMGKNFSEFSLDDRQLIISWVNLALYRTLFWIKRKGDNLEIISDTEEYTIRAATSKDIEDIALLAKRIYPCPINDFNVKKPWHDKNPKIFYIYRDNYGLWANINLLPLSEEFYLRLRSGQVYESAITKQDIHSLDERDQVRCIYIEGLAATLSRILIYFAASLERMISSLAVLGDDLIICSFGGSKEGDLLMKNSGFKQTGWAVDPKEQKSYPFYEITWKKLKSRLKPPVKFPLDLAKDGRLTEMNSND